MLTINKRIKKEDNSLKIKLVLHKTASNEYYTEFNKYFIFSTESYRSVINETILLLLFSIFVLHKRLACTYYIIRATYYILYKQVYSHIEVHRIKTVSSNEKNQLWNNIQKNVVIRYTAAPSCMYIHHRPPSTE